MEEAATPFPCVGLKWAIVRRMAASMLTSGTYLKGRGARGGALQAVRASPRRDERGRGEPVKAALSASSPEVPRRLCRADLRTMGDRRGAAQSPDLKSDPLRGMANKPALPALRACRSQAARMILGGVKLPSGMEKPTREVAEER